MAKPKSLDDAKLLYLAGTALPRMRTFIMSSPLTQPDDIVDDARQAVNTQFDPGKIKSYIGVLAKYGLKREAKEIKETYKDLRRTAQLPDIPDLR